MKKLIGLLLAAFSIGISAATLVPVQLLNPAGSVAGQAVVSTGPSSVPAWASTPLTGLAAQAANTVVANVTAGSASPTAVALPSCSGANSALKYTSASGFSCGTTYALTSGTLAQFAATTSAQLAGVVSDETGTGVMVFSASPALTGTPTAPTAALSTNTTQIATTAFVLANSVTSSSPTITTPNIVGVTNASNAAAGSVGEVLTATATGVALSSGVTANVTSISLTAGDWDVSGMVGVLPAGSTTLSNSFGGSSTTSATLGPFGSSWQFAPGATATGAAVVQAIPTIRYNVSSTTTVYLVASASFGVSTCTASGTIRARRIR